VIVRVNQLDVRRAEEDADWASQGMLGPIWYSWPPDTRAFEFLILDRDEQQQPLDEAFRQKQLRMTLPHAIAAMREPGEEVVIRLDGPLTPDDLLPAFEHLTEPDLTGRFCVSAAQKLDAGPMELIGSVRIQPSPQNCSEICLNPRLGLHRSVRLRAFGVPEACVEPLLLTNETDNPRWREILPKAGFVLTTTRGLRALQLTTRRFDAVQVKTRLMQRLMTASRPVAPTPSYR
jgi:hypothetical protein